MIDKLKGYFEALKSLFFLIGRENRRVLIVHMLGLIIVAILEMSLVTAIIPFVGVVENSANIEKVQRYVPYLRTFNDEAIVFLLGVTLLVLLFVGNGFASFMMWRNNIFGRMQHYRIARCLLIAFLGQPYSFFLQKNSAEYAHYIHSHSVMASSVILNFMQMISRAFVVLGLLAIVFYADPVPALSGIIVLGTTYFLLYKLVSRVVARIGNIASRAAGEAYQVLSETMGGIKEVKLASLEEHYIRLYSDPLQVAFKNDAISSTLSGAPRYIVEAVAFGAMVVVILVLVHSRVIQNGIFSTVALFVFAGYRMLPALQAVYSSMVQIRFSWPYVKKIEEEIRTLQETQIAKPPSVKALPFKNEIRLENIRFRYNMEQDFILDNFNLRIPIHSIVGFIGKTGSGKTTLVDMMLGLLTPLEGFITVDGVILSQSLIPAWQKNLGYVPQNIYLVDDTMANNIAFGVNKSEVDLDRVREVAALASLSNFVENDLPGGYQARVGERGVRLSGGQRQRVGIARALYHDPEVLVLDEATSALDSETEAAVIDAIHNLNRKKTVLMIAHRLTTLAGCDFVVDLEKKRILKQEEFREAIVFR